MAAYLKHNLPERHHKKGVVYSMLWNIASLALAVPPDRLIDRLRGIAEEKLAHSFAFQSGLLVLFVDFLNPVELQSPCIGCSAPRSFVMQACPDVGLDRIRYPQVPMRRRWAATAASSERRAGSLSILGPHGSHDFVAADTP